MSALPESRLAWRQFGEILVERGLVSFLELHDALRQQQQEGGRLGEILFERGLVSAVDLRDALAEQHGLDLRVEARTSHALTAEEQQHTFALGSLLVRKGMITGTQLDAALAEQAATGQRLGQILIASDAISPFTLAAALAEQQGLLAASRDPQQPFGDISLSRSRSYEVREIADDISYRLYASHTFLDATDLAFAVLHEWEPNELHVVCIADDDPPEQLCWQYPSKD